jgi:hypothetical protein
METITSYEDQNYQQQSDNFGQVNDNKSIQDQNKSKNDMPFYLMRPTPRNLYHFLN